ncbi:MAG: DUF547 domain-containing protein [Cytophagales bacterium]|nr:DUF547 domain-containing protein [Cytophagales bacterium]
MSRYFYTLFGKAWHLIFILGFFSFSELRAQAAGHAIWSEWLGLYVSETGAVDYARCLRDSKGQQVLDGYLGWLDKEVPHAAGRNQRLAYWINAYNAFTIQLILKHYPLKSIKDIEKRTGKGPWDHRFISLGGKTYSLNQIEHELIRPTFKDARVHFALVCAAKSCPKLLNQAYLPETISAQLDRQARLFLEDEKKNKIRPRRLEISQVFKWFEEDFTAQEPLITYLNRYTPKELSSKARISYLPYDWSLNED